MVAAIDHQQLNVWVSGQALKNGLEVLDGMGDDRRQTSTLLNYRHWSNPIKHFANKLQAARNRIQRSKAADPRAR